MQCPSKASLAAAAVITSAKKMYTHNQDKKKKMLIMIQGMGGLVCTATHPLPFPEITFKRVECNL